MSASKAELREMLSQLTQYVGLAHCCGDKCRLPHCDCCNGDVDVAYERLDALEARIAIACKETD